MNFTEKIPLERLQKLNKLTCDEYMKLVDKKEYKKADIKAHFKQIKQYVRNMIKAKGEMKMLYKYSEKGDKGRLFCSDGIQGLDKIIRGFLFSGFTCDMDMKNAHPVILAYLCKLHGIRCPILTEYIQDRDTIINSLKEDGIPDPKILILKIVNSEYNSHRIKSQFIKDITKEIKNIRVELIQVDEYKKFLVDAIEYKKANIKGSFINRLLCYYENEILQVIINIVNQKSIEITALAFDGLLLYHNEDSSLREEIQQKVNETFDGLNMTLTFKEHANVITDELLNTIEDMGDDDMGVFDDNDAAQTLYKLYPHWVTCNKELFTYNEDTGLWGCNTEDHLNIAKKYINELRLNVKDDNGDIKKTLYSYGATLSKFTAMIPFLKSININDNWLTEKANSSLGYVYFKNGYLDMENKVFYKTFNPEIVSFNRLEWDYNPDEEDDNHEYRQSIINRFFVNPLNAHSGSYLILELAKALAGDLDKRFIFGLGTSNCGKSILTTAIKNAFGKYFGAFNGEVFAYNKNSGDEASQMRWALALRFCRIIMSNEINNRIELNGNALKKVSAGGDELVGRGLYQKETNFVPHFLVCLMANDIPPIKPKDDAFYDRAKVFNYVKPYVDEPSNEFELKKDRNIGNEIKTDKFIRTFIYLLVDTYYLYKTGELIQTESPEMIEAKSLWIGETDEKDVFTQFNDDFEITNNKDDYIIAADLQEWLKENSKLSPTKFGVEFKNMCKRNKYDKVDKIQKRIEGKRCWVWTGLKTLD